MAILYSGRGLSYAHYFWPKTPPNDIITAATWLPAGGEIDPVGIWRRAARRSKGWSVMIELNAQL